MVGDVASSSYVTKLHSEPLELRLRDAKVFEAVVGGGSTCDDVLMLKEQEQISAPTDLPIRNKRLLELESLTVGQDAQPTNLQPSLVLHRRR
jgi:hypothetical protein